MARVLVYKRAVDAVLTDTHATTVHDAQDGIKVKEEPVDATLNTDTSQDYICVKNYSMITHEEAFSNNDLHVNVNNKENDGLSNNCPIQVENVKKSLSLKRKSAETKKEQVIVNLSKKKRKCSNEIVNENRNALRKSAIKNSQRKTKRKCAIVCTKIKTREQTFSCDICFREFSSITNCVLHKQYYEFIGKFKCNDCKIYCTTRENLRTHIVVCHRKNMRYLSSYHCNFCDRKTKDKMFLQSHLFHAHRELICSINITKSGDLKMEDLTSANTSYKNDVLEQEESLHSNNAITVEESNTVFINDTNKSLHENMLKTEESMVEKSFNNKLIPTKQLRQPTLAEYLELGKKKRDVKSSPNKLDILKDHLSTFALHRNDEKIKDVKSNFSEEHNGQTISPVKQSNNSSEEHNGQPISSVKQSSNSSEEHNGQPISPVKQSNNSSEEHNGQPISSVKQSSNSSEEHNGQPISPVKQPSNSSEEHNRQPISPIKQSSNSSKQITHSTVKQTKKPFVKLHADVEMMKSFLEKLPTIKHEENGNHRNNILRYDREVPYSLRSLRNASFPKKDIRLRNRQGRFISKMSQFNSDNIKTEQVTHSNKADSSFEKIPIAHFKCKECIIPLQRCNDNIRNDKVSTVDITFKEENASLNVQRHYDPTLSQDTNVPSKTLKELEISVKRLSTGPVVNTVTVGTVSDIEKKNHDYFLCKVCKVRFSSKSAKREHIKSFHVAYMSSICNARYTMKHKLLQHYLREHRVKQNQCCVCLALFSDYIELKRHLCIHCLKYVQKENDQYPIDIEVKCKSNKKKYKCLQCNKVFPSQSVLEMHQNCCLIQDEIGDQKDSVKELDSLSNNILKMSHNKNNDEIITVRQDDKISPNDLPESSNNSEKTPEKCQPSLDSEKLKISEDNQESPVNNNNSIAEEIGTVNGLQDSKKSSENNESANNDQDVVRTVSTQLDATDSKVTVYPCDICGKQFQNQKNLQQHIRTFNYSTDVCPICGTAFSSKRLLQSHIAAAHVPQISNTYNFHCVFCNQGFIKKHELRPHVLHLHSQQMINTFTCDSFVTQEKSDILACYTSTCKVCNLMFETQDRYIEHRMYYYKNHTFTCLLCAQNFQGMYMFHHHNKLVHSSEDKRKSYSYICEICKEGFNHESHFHSHTMHVHSNEDTLANAAKKPEGKNQFDPIPEEILGEQIVQSKIINLFAKQRKEIEQSFMNEYICRVCQMRCSNLDDMIKHKTFYSNDGDFRCDKCNRRCKTLDVLTQHKKLTHTYRDIFNGHACYDCGEILETITSLTYHEKHFHPISVQSNIGVSNNAKYKNYDQTSSPNTACKPQQSESNNCLENKYKYRCLFCNTRFSSVHTVQTHIIKTHIDDILVKQVSVKQSNSTVSTIHDNDMQKKTVPQRIETGQASSSNNNPTQFSQQINSIVKTVLPEKKQNKTTIGSPNSLNVTMLYRGSDNVVQKISTPAILKESDIIPTFTVPALNEEFNVNTPIPICSKSTYSHQINDRVVSKFEPANKPIPMKPIPVNRSVTKVYKTLLILPPLQSIATTNRKPILENNYTCPLCPLEYPSLMFFHAHMRYAHADSVRTDMRNPQLNQSAQKASVIECLLCPYTFTDECNYKKHLRNSHAHYVYIPSSKMGKTANDTSDSATNNNKKSINSEIITIDDDDDDNNDDDNIKNTPDQSTTKVTSVAVSSVHKQQDEKIGKLKVRSFARIIEHSSTDHALKNLQPI